MQSKTILLAGFFILYFTNISFTQTPDLGAATTFALFTSVGAFNGDAATSIIGDIGTNAGAFTPPGFHVGQVHLADPVSAQAAADLGMAYGYLAGLTCGSVLTTPLGNSQTLSPNIYCIGTAAVLNADLILDGGGNPGAVFIFQIDGALSTNPFSNIILINGANLCNVYWQINGAFNVGGNTLFQGTVLAAGAINLANGAKLFGRGLSTSGAISTSANIVTLPAACNCTLDISCPSANGGVFSCPALIPAGSAADIGVNNSCGATTVTIANTATGAGCTASPYILTRIYTVTDIQGHQASCTVTYTAIDQTVPTITCPAAVTVQCTGQVPAVNTAAVVATDNCSGTPTVTFLSDVISNQTCANRYTITRTYRASDACGNSATCAQTITVFDNTVPGITCPAAVTVQCASQVPTVNTAAVVVTDNCGGGTPTVTFLGDAISNQSCANRYTITRTYLATDACGNSATCAQTITVFDNTAPGITCQANVNVQCAGQVPTANIASVTVGTDNCGGGAPTVTFLGDVTSNQTCANRFTITRTYQAADACGNSATCAQTITVFDNTAPGITCPASVNVACAGQMPEVNIATVTAGTDNCGGGAPTVTFVGDVTSNQTCANRFITIRTYQVADACGNTATCSQTITVFDNTAPSIICPAAVNVACANQVPAANTASVTVGTDNCGGGAPTVTFVGDVISNQSCPNRFTITRTYRVADVCGNSATCSQTITVLDNTAPTIICPGNVSVSCVNQVPVNTGAVTVGTDNCNGVPVVTFLGDVLSNQICANRLTLTRTYQVADACGNSSTCAQTIFVNDQTPPTIACPVNVTVSCAGNVPIAAPGSVVTSDLCGGPVTVVLVGDVISNQTCANRFTVTRTYRATDACGNSAICAQTITVNDQTVPTLVCPAPVTVPCAGQVPAANIASVTASADDCGGIPVISFLADVLSNQTCVNRFTITRTYRAVDVCGNSASCAQIITVFDNIAPTFLNPPANVTVECLLSPPPVPTLTATDNCTGPVTVVFLGQVQTAGICPTLYVLNRSWSATDACGNATILLQSVTVVDTHPPQFINGPGDALLECNATTNEESFQNWVNIQGGASATDCSAITWTSLEMSAQSGCGATSKRTMRFIATDVCGNSAFQDASMIIEDLSPPIFTIKPQNLEIECMEGCHGEAQLLEWLEHFADAVVTDNCGSVTTEIAFISEKQDCGNTYSRIYQFRATDECGNTNFVTATFAVVDHTPPVIVKCPPGNTALTCVNDVPGPDLAGVIATDNCGMVKIMATTFTTGTGCKNSPMTVSYWYMATDECGNMVSNCDQSFQVVDTIAPVYSGPDTLYVVCIDDLPATGEIMGILMPYMVDNCYDFTCIGHITGQNGANSVTYTMVAKDFCGNVANQFTVTFIATGICKPFCTTTQTVWGNTAGIINGAATTGVITQLINQFGPVTAGKLGKTITAPSAPCVQNMLPSTGNTVQFGPGNYAADNCQLPSKLLNADGTLKNKLAANVMAMQLNIWYNQQLNGRNLGILALSGLPACLVDAVVLAKMPAGHLTVQGLLNLSNDYLAGVGFFPQNFGALLNTALENLNAYWQNCQANPSSPCPSNINVPNATVSGAIKTEKGLGLDEAYVDLVGSGQSTPPYSIYDRSSEAGSYAFPDAIPVASDLTVTPTKDDNPLNGVSTYDLVLISQHILGLAPLNSPYKMIAADVNKSGSVTTYDVVELRKLILGIYQELPYNTSWRFVDRDFVFPNPANPFQTPFPENKTLTGIQTSLSSQDFIAVKIGDLNDNAIANAQQGPEDRTMGTLFIDVEDRVVQTGESFDLTFQTAEIASGFQFTMNLNGLKVAHIEENDQVDAGNFGLFPNAPDGTGTLTVSVNGAQAFTLRFHATKAGRISTLLGLSNRVTRAEAYTPTGARQEVALRFHSPAGTTVNGVGFELYQNEPNPFVDKTLIGFHLPQAAQATLTVYDATGKLVYSRQGDFAQGYNSITVEQALPTNAGLLYYKLETATDMAIRKMIQVH